MAFFNENWLLSSVVYAPLQAYFMFESGDLIDQDSWQRPTIRTVCCVMLYLAVAYRVELLSKRAFIGPDYENNP